MAKCCGGGATCACVLTEGTGITVTGSGSSQDPFVLSSEREFTVADNTTFNLTVTGSGTVADPWELEVNYALTAKLDDLPDVNAPTPTNGQVLAWNTGTGRWINTAPTTAASGSVAHDTSLTGDGSAPTPLAVVAFGLRFLEVDSAGVGINDDGINQMVRKWPDVTARATPTPAVTANTLSILDNAPGQVDYWTGTEWLPIEDRFDTQIIGAALLEMSGPYTDQRLTQIVKQVDTTTDVLGMFEVLSVAELTGKAGVIMAMFQATGATAWGVSVYGNVDHIEGLAFSIADGSAAAGIPITGTCYAWTY